MERYVQSLEDKTNEINVLENEEKNYRSIYLKEIEILRGFRRVSASKLEKLIVNELKWNDRQPPRTRKNDLHAGSSKTQKQNKTDSGIDSNSNYDPNCDSKMVADTTQKWNQNGLKPIVIRYQGYDYERKSNNNK